MIFTILYRFIRMVLQTCEGHYTRIARHLPGMGLYGDPSPLFSNVLTTNRLLLAL